jgi:transcriptional regulator with XRE-family HTH domain
MEHNKDIMLSFGNFLLGLRRRQGITQRVLAAQAGIAVRTLSYWEAGMHLPNRHELQNLLTHLQATAQERESLAVLALLPVEERLTEQVRLLPNADAMALPIGDLLWALRMRHGWTQEQLAAEFGLRRLTVVRWENGNNLPSGETVARLSARLCVSAEEQRALWNAHLRGLIGGPLSLEVYRAQAERMEQTTILACDPLFELSVLLLQHSLHRQAKEVEEAVSLLARVEVRHSGWLYYQDRRSESRVITHRALNRVRYRFQPEPYWLDALNLASAYVDRCSGEAAGARYLLRWLPRLPSPAMQAHVLADSAVWAILAGDTEQATTLIAAAHQVIRPDLNVDTDWYVRLSTARIELAMTAHSDAWEAILQELPHPSVLIHYLLIGASSALLAGANRAAEGYLRRAESLLTADIPDQLLRRFAELTQQWDGGGKTKRP